MTGNLSYMGITKMRTKESKNISYIVGIKNRYKISKWIEAAP